MAWQPGFEHAAKHGFSTTDFTDHFDDAFTVHNGIDQGVQNGPTLGAAIKKLRIRCDAERWPVKSEKLGIHVG